MLGPPTLAARFPPWWGDRAFSLPQSAHIMDVAYDTAYRWVQLLQAAGLCFGQKRGRDLMFDAHELYALRILTSFHRAGIPIGPTQIRAVAQFAFDPNGTPRIPEGKLIQAAPESEFSVDAVKIYNAVIEATRPEDAHAN